MTKTEKLNKHVLYEYGLIKCIVFTVVLKLTTTLIIAIKMLFRKKEVKQTKQDQIRFKTSIYEEKI